MNVILENGVYRYICPHCELLTEVHEKELNCCIFRHGVYQQTYKPINPHASQQEVQRLKLDNAIIGCGGPHQLKLIDGQWTVHPCPWSS